MNSRNLISTCMAALAACCVYIAYLNFVDANVMRVIVNGVFEADTRVKVSSVDEAGGVAELATFEVPANPGSVPQLAGTQWLNKPIKRLQIELLPSKAIAPNAHPQVAFHSVQITRSHGTDIFVGANRMYSFFSVLGATDANQARLSFAGTDHASRLLSVAPVAEPNRIVASLLAALFFCALLFIFRNADWAQIPAYADMSLGREISSSHEFGTINGVRGLAAILVLLSHTAPGFHALGVGLTLLFVISGFLLSKPFILDKQRIYSFTNIEVFITKRLKRILPMYYLYIFIIYVVSLQLDVALRHFLFVQAEGHLWPMTQIFAFYMILPLVLLGTSALHRLHWTAPVVTLCIASVLWFQYMTDWTPFFNGQYFHEFYLYAFLLGVAASYLHYGGLAKSASVIRWFETWRWPLALLGIAITLLTIAWSAPVQPPRWFAPYISQFYVKCLLSILIILLALNVQGTWFNALMKSWFLRSMGIVGFSFYILHGLGMQLVQAAQQQLLGIPNPADRSWGFFFASLVVTYLLSLITYSYVERPFFGFRRKAES